MEESKETYNNRLMLIGITISHSMELSDVESLISEIEKLPDMLKRLKQIEKRASKVINTFSEVLNETQETKHTNQKMNCLYSRKIKDWIKKSYDTHYIKYFDSDGMCKSTLAMFVKNNTTLTHGCPIYDLYDPITM